MEDLSVLGNAAAVPIVITITQFVKRNVSMKRAPEVIALCVSLVLCFGWELYKTSPEALNAVLAGGALSIFRWVIDNIIVGFATWLSASKLYDFSYGEKKTQQKFEEINRQKDALQQELHRISNSLAAPSEQEAPQNVEPENKEVSDKLEDILEGRD